MASIRSWEKATSGCPGEPCGVIAEESEREGYVEGRDGEEDAVSSRPLGSSGRWRDLVRGDEGTSTVEYALTTLAAAAFGAVLYTVVTGDSVVAMLTEIIDRALTTRP